MSNRPWFKFYGNMPRHEKSYALANLLGVPRAWTHVAELLCWVSQCVPSASLAKFSPRDIAREAGWTGEADVFLAALVECGWLTPDLQVVGWAEKQDAYERKKANDRARAKARYDEAKRLKLATEQPAKDAPQLATSPILARENLRDSAENRAVEEKRREEKRLEEREVAKPKRHAHSRGVVGLAEQEAAPQTPEELTAHLQPSLQALDGQAGRPALLDEVRARWPNFRDKLASHGLEAALAAIGGWIRADTRYERIHKVWVADGNVDVDRELEHYRRTRYGPPPAPGLRPLDDEVVS